MTDEEAYDTFEEHYKEQVHAAMKERSDNLRQKYRKDTEYNCMVHERLAGQETCFPSKAWFLSKKPPETKLNSDHTTGLCKDCHSTQVNYATLLRHLKYSCKCRTEKCPNWICLCEGDEECSCNPVCGFEDCLLCQVSCLIIS